MTSSATTTPKVTCTDEDIQEVIEGLDRLSLHLSILKDRHANSGTAIPVDEFMSQQEEITLDALSLLKYFGKPIRVIYMNDIPANVKPLKRLQATFSDKQWVNMKPSNLNKWTEKSRERILLAAYAPTEADVQPILQTLEKNKNLYQAQFPESAFVKAVFVEGGSTKMAGDGETVKFGLQGIGSMMFEHFNDPKRVEEEKEVQDYLNKNLFLKKK